ncbi:unnamed protein product [Cylicocyclus nassatus]|uniref:Battenin n=1 Tax=Cylicocyclus nassatus TaxID=53992 RepID=A0AA36HBM4_CYLNA|nr:unnamed protein product [Cylicocyclus nassatus]
MTTEKARSSAWRNLVSFCIFGLCNNFAYIVMLSAAQDILKKNEHESYVIENATEVTCVPKITTRICSPTSTGVVLLCNIIPCLLIKLLCPFIMHRVPYWLRHSTVCFTQASSLIITAFADSVPLALVGVCLASFSSGLGETTYLGLAGHYSKQTIATWSSGTGMAGLVGSFSYAGLTDRHLLGLTPAQAMLVMLVVPALFMFTYFMLLEHTDMMKQVSFRKSKSGKSIDLGKNNKSSAEGSLKTSSSTSSAVTLTTPMTFAERIALAKCLLRYMIPLFLVYFAEYLINQGLLELIIFDCSHGFGTTPAAQYRWYQVLYQIGVFVSRSSINFIQLNMLLIAMMPGLQLLNTVLFLFNAIYAFLPNFAVVAGLVLYEGLIGGGSYVNTFHHIHKKVEPTIREFALSTVSLADSFGIMLAAFAAIPVHNAICAMQWYR